MMKASLLEQMKELFGAALEMEEPARSAYLEAACAEDTELGRAVAEILDGRGAASGFLSGEVAGSQVGSGLGPVFREGQVVAGRFRILRFQGRGGMGEVYEAIDERLRLRLALKTIRSELAGDLEARERFQREILMAREVSHPNLCRVFDLIEDRETDGTVRSCLTMEWLEGRTLQEVLKERRPLELRETSLLLRQVAEALDALHTAQILHRDLKPGNIMLVEQPDGSKRAVVMDFGLSKPLVGGGDGDGYESSEDVQAGAPYFMAPELLKNQKLTAASDIYAFGLVLDECVTKSRAFDAGSLGAMYYQRIWETPISPRQRAEGLPPEWEQAILRCLEAKPELRPTSAVEVMRSVAGEVALSKPLSKGVWRPGLLMSIAAMLGIGILMVMLAGWFRPPALQTSVVVFPINDHLNDASYKYLPGGLTAELVSRLSQVNGLSVKQYYRPREQAPLESIRERFHLDGDLQKFEKRVRLTLRLTDSENGNRVVWSDKFDREMVNPLDLQAEVVGSVMQGLEKRVFAEASAGVQAKYAGFHLSRSITGLMGFSPDTVQSTQSAAAYHSYLRGRQLLDERTPTGVEQAIQMLELGLREDAKFGLIHAALADAHVARIDGQRGDQEELLRVAAKHAEEAVRLSPGAPEAHVALASVRQMQWDWPGAEASYLEAIRLSPRSPVAYRRYGGLIIQFGRFDEALSYVRKGIEMDPYDYPAQSAYGLCLALARRFAEAEAQFLQTLKQSNFISAHNNLGSVYSAMAREAQGEARDRFIELALREASIVRDMEVAGRDGVDSPSPVSDYMFGLAYAIHGNRSAARERVEHLRRTGNGDRLAPASLAIVHAAMGETEVALQYLRSAAQIKDRKLLYLKVLSHWDPLRNTRDYKELIVHMRL